MKWLVLCLAIAGCAKAGPGNEIVGGLTDAGTEGGGRDPDGGAGREPGGAPVDVTLSQTDRTDITPTNAINCDEGESDYFRVFTPSDAGVTNAFAVAEVDFGIESAKSAITATLQILPYTGTPGDTLDPTALGAPLATQTVQIAQTTASTTQRVPITATIPAGTSFAVELASPSPDLFIGTNDGTETRAGYLRATGCGITRPTKLQKIATDNNITSTIVMVMSVNGSH
ncbi:MAG TPA: hypothetical protein VFP84_36855 [Kofleriaceae bacterium]|nr:hypothetical protein [Kofleriaceae bacterium]